MLTKSEREEIKILAEIKENPSLTVATHAKRLKVTSSRIYYVLTKNGIGRGQFKGLSRNAYRMLALLLYTDKSLAAIGRELSVSRARVYDVSVAAAFNGIKFKKRGR